MEYHDVLLDLEKSLVSICMNILCDWGWIVGEGMVVLRTRSGEIFR